MCHIILPKVDNIDDYDPIKYIEKYVEVRNYIRKNQINEILGIESDDET
ncbi:MAG: hypothetical protein J5936_02515 [Acholeplasmatales bacterium]|nr:hypothetical protein [Acholeplasmatales bacterium]